MPEDAVPNETPGNPWEDLVVSLLSVNQYSLERTYNSVEGLREQKIIDPLNLASWKLEEIESRLCSAGCDRGPFMTKLFADRLSALGKLVQGMGIDKCKRVLESADVEAIGSLLLPVKGVGPVVLRNFFILRNIQFVERFPQRHAAVEIQRVREHPE